MSFPRYPEYKESGVEWLGQVPAHWTICALKRLFRVVGGSTPSSGEDAYWDGDIRWATPVDLGKHTSLFLSETQRTITEAGLNSCGTTVVPTNSIVISTRAPIGSVAIAGVPMCTNQGCKSLVPAEPVASRYWARLLSVNTEALELRGRGATFLELSGDELGNFKAPCPPLAEQSMIADFVDEEVSKIDALVAEQERLIELMKEKRQAVISHAVTHGLNPHAPMRDSGVSWLGRIPAHWEAVQSRRMFRVRSEPALESDRQLTASQKYGVVFQSDFVEAEGRRVVEVLKWTDKLIHVEPDDFIISMRSFQGGIEWCRLRGSTSYHYVILTPVKHVFPPFFAHLFKSSSYIQALRATTDLIRDGQELRYSHFVQVPLPVVPLDEQQAIAGFLDVEIKKMDALMTEADRAIGLLQERRAALISAAVTGQIDLRAITTTADSVPAPARSSRAARPRPTPEPVP